MKTPTFAYNFKHTDHKIATYTNTATKTFTGTKTFTPTITPTPTATTACRTNNTRLYLVRGIHQFLRLQLRLPPFRGVVNNGAAVTLLGSHPLKLLALRYFRGEPGGIDHDGGLYLEPDSKSPTNVTGTTKVGLELLPRLWAHYHPDGQLGNDGFHQ